jgi:hypothetical protein
MLIVGVWVDRCLLFKRFGMHRIALRGVVETGRVFVSGQHSIE